MILFIISGHCSSNALVLAMVGKVSMVVSVVIVVLMLDCVSYLYSGHSCSEWCS